MAFGAGFFGGGARFVVVREAADDAFFVFPGCFGPVWRFVPGMCNPQIEKLVPQPQDAVAFGFFT